MFLSHYMASARLLQGDQLDKPGAVRVFRNQLGRINAFYSFDPPAKSDRSPPALKVP